MKQVNKTDRFLIIATVLFLIIYSVWRLGWTIPADTVSLVCWIVLTVVEFVGLFELGVFIYEYTKKEEVRLPEVGPTTGLSNGLRLFSSRFVFLRLLS